MRQAGFWNPGGINRVYGICSNGAKWWAASSGSGSLSSLKALAASNPSCVFNVSPKEFPIFVRPYSGFGDGLEGYGAWLDEDCETFRGADLANFTTFTMPQVGGSGPGLVDRVCHSRHINAAHGDFDNHGAFDWWVFEDGQLNEDWRVRSVAPGQVVAAGARTALHPSGCPGQVEVYIHHVVATSLSSQYREEFWSYYAHMESLPSGIVPGANVSTFTDLGEVGTTGCSSAYDHLHFGVFRVRNVTGALTSIPSLPHTAGVTDRRMIDPFGWNHSGSVDPWAFWAPSGSGAASMNLWIPTAEPPDWATHELH